MKGFIQIPVLIAVIISALVFGGGGYLIAERATHSSRPSEETTTINTTTAQDSVIVADENPKDLVEKKVEQASSATSERNYRAEVEIAINNRIKYDEEVGSYINELLAHIDLVIKRFTDTREATARLGGSDETTKLLIVYYDNTVTYAQAVRAQVAYSYTKVQTEKAQLRNYLNALPNSISKEKAIEDIQVAENLTTVQGLRDSTTTIYEKFRANISSSDAKLEMAFKIVSERQSYQAAQPVYAAPLLPQVQVKTKTYTYCKLLSDTVSCTTY